MNSSADRMMEFLGFLEWCKRINRDKKSVLVNPVDPDMPFVAYHDGDETHYGWAKPDLNNGTYTVEFE